MFPAQRITLPILPTITVSSTPQTVGAEALFGGKCTKTASTNKPGVQERIIDGHQDAWYAASLDLYQCGYLGINDYFGQIMAAGYTLQDGASADEWVNGKIKIIYTQFFQGEEPYETYGVVAYHKNRTIRLDGNRSDGSVSAKYDSPSLTITYKYFEQYY